jgi:hypothetical protein
MGPGASAVLAATGAVVGGNPVRLSLSSAGKAAAEEAKPVKAVPGKRRPRPERFTPFGPRSGSQASREGSLRGGRPLCRLAGGIGRARVGGQLCA